MNKSIFYLSTCASLLVFSGCTKIFHPCSSGNIPSTSTLQTELKTYVRHLSETIGERHAYRSGSMESTAAYLEQEFRSMGYLVKRQAVRIPKEDKFGSVKDSTVYNIIAWKSGSSPQAQTLIIGAHYDTKVGMDKWNSSGPPRPARIGTPGANDNASGIAAMMAVAKALKNQTFANNACFVAYANEEPPFFHTESMGSTVHAKSALRQYGKDKILGMITLESMGIYSPRVNKKRVSAFCAGLTGLTDRCDYVAFMSTNTGKEFSRECADLFVKSSRFPVRSVVFPYYTKGVSWSDDWSYMKQGIPSFAITDTAYLRSDDYHETSDTWDKLDYPQFAEVTHGVIYLIQKLLR